MKKIMFVCSAGMSTSMLAAKTQTAADEAGFEAKIWACAENDAKAHYDEVDAILLGPQVRYLLPKIQGAVKDKKAKVSVIEATTYGRMDGKTVLEQIKALIGA